MAMTVEAYMNHGRWLANCPDCNTANLVKHDRMVCARCNPDVLATKKVISGLNGRKLALSLLTGRSIGDVETVTKPDLQRRAAAMAKAKVYSVSYRIPKGAVEQVLRPRRTQNMNWLPGETLADLQRENAEHKVTA